MSHELEQHEEQVAFVDTRTDAWHRLNNLPEHLIGTDLSAEDALMYSHLANWNVRKIPAEVRVDGQYVEIPETYATVRDNPFEPGKVDVLGSVGKQWTAFQNEELTEFLNTLVHESGGKIETAGSIRRGREVFITMKMPETMMVGGVDRLDLYLAALTAHDGSKATRFIGSPVRVVCANTQRWAEEVAVARASIRHTVNQTHMVEVARQKLNLAFRQFSDFQSEAERMIQTTMAEREFAKAIDEIFGEPDEDSKRSVTMAKNRKDSLLRLWDDADTNGAIRGTRWAGLQSVSEYLDHEAPVKGTADGTDAAVKRAERVILGGQSVSFSKAFKVFRVPVPEPVA